MPNSYFMILFLRDFGCDTKLLQLVAELLVFTVHVRLAYLKGFQECTYSTTRENIVR